MFLWVNETLTQKEYIGKEKKLRILTVHKSRKSLINGELIVVQKSKNVVRVM